MSRASVEAKKTIISGRKNMTISTKLLLCSCAAIGALTAGAAHAQSVEAGAAAPQSEVGGLQDIVVTAQKRSENMQDVPIAVSAVRGDALAALGVQDATQLKIAVPTLYSANSNGYYTSNIRGIGSFGYGVLVEAPVSLYIDGVYLASPLSSQCMLNNIESVEVLKGPQGTLFGRNATGGLVHIHTLTPGSNTVGRFSAEYGNYDILSAAAYLSGPITDQLSAGISANVKTQGDGFGRNVTRGGDTNRLNHAVNLRSKWVWRPGSDTTVTLTGDYADTKGSQPDIVAAPGTLSGFVPGKVAPDLGWGSESNLPYRQKTWSLGTSLRIEQDLGSVNLTSTTAYRKQRYNLVEDLDFGSVDVGNLFQIQNDKQFSQEIQLSSKGSSRLQWTGGLYYFNAKSHGDPLFIGFQNFAAAGNSDYVYRVGQRAESGAVFGQATYEVLDNTRITLGGRYTKEKKTEPAGTLDIIAPSAPVITIPNPERSVNFSKFTYRISVDHRFSDDVLAYASFNTGFKSGGFNANSPGAAPYRPEKLKAYEIGLKSELFDRRLRLN